MKQKKMTLLKTIVIIVFLFAGKMTHAQTENCVRTDTIPSAIKEYMETEYKAYTMNVAEALYLNDKPVGFSIELQKKNKIVRLRFDLFGTLLKTTKSKVYTFEGTEPTKKQTSHSKDDHSGHQH